MYIINFPAYTVSVPDLSRCKAAARTETGWVCGARRRAVSGSVYASFLGVPYAKQPLGELRFQELLPAEPWDNIREAKAEGPVCPQTDVFYGRIKTASGGMSEACIHANIHVPIEALPDPKKPPSCGAKAAPGLPILVFIHGGGFAFGSGDTDLHGPEYLVSKGVIVITFNYRLNVFGFLSLNSTQVPGNAGLRDAVTLLRWVQRNARFFGGSPGSVTLAGQSAGAAITHILTLSTSARSLFHRAILLSGTAFSDFFSSSPLFAKTINSLFLPLIGINATLPADEIHQKLIETPINAIMEANKKLINLFGTTTFTPVVESYQPGITPILEDDPEVLLDSGRGSEIPLLIGFTDAECESFRPRFKQIDIVAQIEKTPELAVSPRLKFMSGDQLPVVAELMHNKYFNDTLDYDSFLRLCTDQYVKYPALKLASKSSGKAPVFMYRPHVHIPHKFRAGPAQDQRVDEARRRRQNEEQDDRHHRQLHEIQSPDAGPAGSRPMADGSTPAAAVPGGKRPETPVPHASLALRTTPASLLRSSIQDRTPTLTQDQI
ncbi:unnamed protein product [Chilo suppressalis]|uniref:Carboxylic ester hydrolase n=1 Tax=Chilo suppressalis TaxID=168631 RepID=A0ABN8B274_CHISP|nr:unnamed protein product [Chilo suppressalis]